MIVTRRLGPGMLTKGLVKGYVSRVLREVVRRVSAIVQRLEFKSRLYE